MRTKIASGDTVPCINVKSVVESAEVATGLRLPSSNKKKRKLSSEAVAKKEA